MARQRFIWPALWADPDLGRVSERAMLLYIGCFSNADDDGRLIGDPVFLKAEIFRYRTISVAQIAAALRELDRACSAFCIYENRGNSYVAFLNWGDWQKPKYPRPSRLPAPPKRAISAYLRQKSSGNREGTVPEHLEDASGNDSPVGWVGLGSTPLIPPKEEKPRRRRRSSRPSPPGEIERREIALETAWGAFLDGAGWDDSYDETAMIDELERIRSAAHIRDEGYTQKAALTRWRSERKRRFEQKGVRT